jgi:hypothetical protein
VTAGRTRGVGIPAAEAPEPDAHASSEALVREAADTALESLDTLEHQTRDVARRFRRGASTEAQNGLTHLMQSTQTLLKLAALAAGSAGTTLEALCERHDLRAESQTNLAVSELIRQQMTGDRSAIAAVLDHSFLLALAAWRLVFVALGGTPTGPYGHAA